MDPSPCLHISGIPQKENGTNGEQEISFVFCKWKTGTANFHVFAANRSLSFFHLLTKKQTEVILLQMDKTEQTDKTDLPIYAIH